MPDAASIDVFGLMRLLLLHIHHPWTTARYLGDAFSQLGWDVLRAGPGHEIDIPAGRFPAANSVDVRALWRRLEETDRAPDLVLSVDAGGTLYLPGIAQVPVPTAYYGIDAHNYPRQGAAQGAQFDVVFVAQRALADELPLPSSRHVEWLPLAVDPAVFHPIDGSRTMDFAFVGNVGGGHRRQAILEQATASFRGSAVAAPPEESPHIYGAARVGLNIAGNEAALDINMRTFEIPACRTAMLTDGDPVALAQLYRPNEEAVTFSGVADCMAKLEMLLSSPRRCEELAEAGYRRTLSDHTYSHRAARIVDVALATGVTRGRRSFGAQAIVRFWQSRPGVRIQGGLSLKRRVPSDGI